MSSKSKYLFDTSIFTEMLKNDVTTFEAYVDGCANGRRFATYITAIELNRGFLQTFVEHHKKVVELQSPSAAFIVLSNKYGVRKSKYGNILVAYMMQFSGGASGDYYVYTSQLESVIFDMSDRINELVKRFIGHFENHALAAIDLYNKEDYDSFLERCSSSSNIELENFWLDHNAQLLRMRDRIIEKFPRLKKEELELFTFLEDILSGGDSMNYIHISDLAISLDCPANYEMVAHDRSFDLFTSLQDKPGGYVALP